MTDLNTNVETVATRPQSASVTPTSKSVTNISVDDAIKAAKFKAANEAAAGDATMGLRIGRVRANGGAE